MREFDLLQSIYDDNAGLPARVTIPPGDDMGELALAGSGRVLVTVDQIADGRHFLLSQTPLHLIAQKAITRNLSDAAAMAVKPIGCVCSAALPTGFDLARAKELSTALRAVALRHDCPLFGGDVTLWDNPLLISITLLAEPWPGITPILRSTAKPGDILCVSGSLGGSLITLHGKDAPASFPANSPDGYTHHLQFTPRVLLAKALAEKFTPTSMIDLSDGLGRDAGHIAEMSGVSIQIEAEKIPCSLAAQKAAASDGAPAWKHALADGEDYELCFTLTPAQAQKLAQANWTVQGVPITKIGLVTPRTPGQPLVKILLPDGSHIDGQTLGWEHGS